MENSFKDLISKEDSLVVLLPTNAWFDEVAAGLSLYLALSGTKAVTIVSPEDMRVEFNRLVGVNKVTKDVGNKNLVIKFMDYKADNIEKVSYDIEDGQFQLTVTPKQTAQAPRNDQMELSYSGFSGGTAILVGGASINQFPDLDKKEFQGIKKVHVGTKDLAGDAKGIISLAKGAASVSQVAYDLIKASMLPVNQDIATNLLMGIQSGTDNFSSGEVTAEAFEAASALMKIGGKLSPSEKEKKELPEGAMPQVTPKPQAQDVQVQQAPKEDQPQENQGQTPKSWLEPKIYKGTSIK